MKNLAKLLFVGIIFIFSIFLSNNALAAVTKNTTVKVSPVDIIVLAEVNIQDAKIDKQDNNNFDISFSLSNGKGLQTGVKYGVKLVSTSNKTQTIVDEKIYDESLTLYENSSVKKTIQYTAPNMLDGVYSMFLTSKNEADFPFSTAYLGEIRIKPVTKGLVIDPLSCVYYVNNSKDNSLYSINQVVDIDTTESLGIKCVTFNSSDKEIQVTPSFVTNEKSVYGKVVKTDIGDAKTETFKAGEKKVISYNLPKASLPGLYFLTMGLKQTEDVSNTISLTYLIRGNIASINNLFLDKDYYHNGDVANTSFMWSTVEGKLLRGSSSNNSPIVLTATIKDYNNRNCSKPVTENLVRDFKKPKTDLLINITKDCFNPTITLTLKDGSNTTLDEKSFTMQTVSVKKPTNMTPIVIVVLLILAAAIFYMYNKNKKIIPLNMFFLLMVLLAVGFVPTNKVKANTFSIYSGNCSALASVSLNKSSYSTNETIVASGSESASCSQGGYVSSLGILAENYQGGGFNGSGTVADYYGGTGVSGSYNFTTQSWGGSGAVNFKAYLNGSSGTSSVSYTVSPPAGASVSVWADSNNINAGSQAHIHWSSSNAISCISTDGGTYDTRLNGDYYNTPTADKKYSVTCFGADNNPVTQSTTVYVTTVTPTVTVWKDSSGSIPYNTTDTIHWSSTNATSCSCFYYNTQNAGNCPGFTSTTGATSGSFSTPNLLSNTTYNFSCSN